MEVQRTTWQILKPYQYLNMFNAALRPTFRWLAVFILLFTLFSTKAQVNPAHVEIVRDVWGVPHIYGKTDADAAYGLAWATCEDDFATVQRLLLAVKGRLGEVDGKDGAILDMLAFIGACETVVDSAYDHSFTPEYKKVVDGYRDGLNAYAAAHPEEVFRKGMFPVTSKHIISQYVLTNMLLTSVYLDIQKIFNGYIKHDEINLPSGSNAFAFDTSRTVDGKTYLAVNSHQPLEGLFSWYEVHMNSEEGMNMLGSTFPGGISVLHGSNNNLGWACTLNHPDMSDVYKLEMNPANRLQYKFDGKWETLEVRKKTVKVKLGAIRIPITKTFYWSKYGTTIKGKDGFYSIRFTANMDVRAPEQIYRMNKAQNFSEWRNVMRMNSIPGMNFVYADRNDTIFYVSTAKMPYRNPEYNWQKVLPGNTSQTLWPAVFYPFDSVPQVLKPKSGYLVNTNNSAFDVTTTECNAACSSYDKCMGYGLEKNNRSIMAHLLIGKYPKLSYDDFKKVKYNDDYTDSIYSSNLTNVRVLLALDPAKYPDLADAIAVMRKYDFRTNIENENGAIILYALYHLIDKISARGTTYENNAFTEKEYVDALRYSKKYMLKHFGKLQIPLGDVQKHVRGNVVLPIGGGPEVLAATITKPYKDGMRQSFVGESYIQLARFSKAGVELETVHAYGASAKPNSPHYTDQMQMFVHKKLKPMTLDKATVYKTAASIYHPGFDAKKEVFSAK